jgi:type I restriction enzyme, S subunit
MIKKYDSYKDSEVEWIGNIPSSWELIRGKFVFQNKKEINNENQELNLLSLTLHGVLNKDINSNDGLRPTEYSTYQIFEEDDLVFKLIDLENTQTSRVGLVHERGIMSPVYIRLEPQKRISSKYSYYYYYDLYKQHIYNFLGSGVRSSLTPSNLLEIEIPLPPLSEQQQIVSFLDTKTSLIDSLIEKTQRKIELLKEKRTSLINEVVTKGLNPNVEMKDSGVEWIGKIPSHWEITKMKYGVSHLSEKGKPENNDIKISPENVESETGVCFNLYSEHDSEGMRFQKGDILLNKLRLYLKKILFTEYNGFSLGEMIVLRTNNKLNNRYFYQLLFSQGLIDLLDSQSTGIKLPRVSPDVILNTEIIYPPLSEQQQIVEYLDEQTQLIDNTISIEEKRIELLKEYRQSLISEVVTGKRKVVE